ncbi:cytochrome P450 [Micromonospora sp. NPDC049662]|uniref:cytochrome P450 n=1 Tax=Micromonospora sp. NPDC049662 TaxID=3155397 RepID=UPI003431B837
MSEQYSDFDAIPGPRGPLMWPVLWRLRRDPVGVYRRSRQRYGDVVRFREPSGASWVFVAHPDAVATVHQRNHRNYSRGKLNGPFAMLLGEGLLTSEREAWSVHRRVLAPPFRRDRQHDVVDVVQQRTGEMLDEWATGGVGRRFDVCPDVERLTFRVVLQAMFDIDLGDREESVLRHLTEALSYVSSESFRMYPLPEWAVARSRNRFEASVAALDREVGVVLATPRANIGGSDRGAVFNALAQSDLPARAVRDELLTMLHAGQHTVATSISFALYLLAVHPWAAERVREELVPLCGRPPKQDDFDSLPYLRRVLLETMRLYPPAWGGVRETVDEDHLSGYRVPGGTPVVFSQYVTHRHPEIWSDPDRFDPDRFTSERMRDLPRYAYFPFGGGPHLCIGEEAAMVELTIVVAMVVQRYQLRLAPGAKVTPLALLDLVPANGVPLILEKA